ncbi:MAG: PAS domain S-box-containing protein [Dokdonia sp.]|jgi:PAS domain S-box-containing protein
MDDLKIKMYERALSREKSARKEAEHILENISQKLYFKTEELKVSNKRLKNLLKETTSELQGVFENILDAYIVMNLLGDVIKMNDAAVLLLGYTLKDNINLMNIVHPDAQEQADTGFNELFNEGAVTNFHIKIVVASGVSRLIHINASIIYNAAGQPIAAQGIVRDITNEKAAEQRIIDSENRLSALISNLDSGVLLEDEHRNIVITNTRFCDFFNTEGTPEQLVGQNCTNAAEQSKGLFQNPEEYVSRIKTLTQEKEQVLEDELTLEDGRILERDFIPILEAGVYKGHLWTYRDVTLHRRFSKSIEAERQKYSNIIANMQLGLIEANNEDQILMVNHSLEIMSGYTQSELVGKRGLDIFLDEEFKKVLQSENSKRRKGTSTSYELQVHTKGGALKHWLISGAPNYDLSGRVVGSIGIHLDITKLKNLEILKENLLKKLEKSNDELQEYAHVVSHDLKSPLRNINALINWIKADNKDTLTKETQGHLEMIDATLEKMERLISDLLDYSSVGYANSISEEVDLNEVLADIEALLHCPENITVTINKRLPRITADKVKIQQLFQNLMSNAIRYCDKAFGVVEICFSEDDRYFTFSVKDNGMGIPKQYHNKIFQIFQSLNRHKESTGIGLSIVKKIVDLYKGEVWLESKVGEGTTFFFTIEK